MTALSTLLYGITIFLHITVEIKRPDAPPSRLAHWLSLIMKGATGILALLLFALAVITITSISVPCEMPNWWCPSILFEDVYLLIEDIRGAFGA
jgi:hypothetical protein